MFGRYLWYELNEFSDLYYLHSFQLPTEEPEKSTGERCVNSIFLKVLYITDIFNRYYYRIIFHDFPWHRKSHIPYPSCIFCFHLEHTPGSRNMAFYFLFLFFYCYFCFYSLSFFLLLFSDSYFSGFIPYIFCQNGSFSAILTR